MSYRRPLLVAVAMAFVFAATSSADHWWGGYHWARTSNPFTLKVGDNVSGVWDNHLNLAIGDWNASSMLDLVKVAGSTRPKSCRPTAGRVEVCNATYGWTGWLGIAQIWPSGGHITQAVAKMNDTYFNTATYNTPSWRQLVMCQEIAHDFGLDHQDENFSNPNLGSCMDYTNNPDGPPSNTRPNAHDYEQLEIIYGHLDGSSTVGQTILPSSMPRAMSEIEFEGPGQWGRLVRSSANGRVQVFEQDFGNGNKVVTHVFWADPEGDARGRR